MWSNEAGYDLDRSRERLDLASIERWLAQESYWARGRPMPDIKRSIANSECYGLYAPDGRQIGFFRIVTDKTTFAWLCDVFVDSSERGHGLALWALTLIRDDVLSTGVYRIVLATSDAHGMYEKLGFTAHAEPKKWMELTTRKIGES